MSKWRGFSKFIKRMRNILIPDVKLYFAKYDKGGSRYGHNGCFIMDFRYQGQSVFSYPKNDGHRDPYFKFAPSTHAVFLFIDGYFNLKHEDTFVKTAQEITALVFEPLLDSWYAKDHCPHYFEHHLANELLMFLKICDRRTSKRSLKKINNDMLNPILRQIIVDRLSNSKNTRKE